MTRSPHTHEHGHDHGAPTGFGRAFAIGIALNIAIVVLQGVYGLIAHSTALLADAGHNLSDVLSLIVAWSAAALSRHPATTRYTYGLKGSSILAALFNAMLLLTVLGGIAWEAVRRFFEPVPVQGATVMAVAAAGIVINGVSAWLFASGRDSDINIRGAFLHMLSDAFVSFGVVCTGAAILFTGWQWLDPAATLGIVVVVMYGTWDLLKDSLRMAMSGVPPHIEPKDVRDYLSALADVRRIHDLHIWPMSTTETALTCHLVMPAGHPGDGFTIRVADELRKRFGIEHSTLQIEVSEDADCALDATHEPALPRRGHHI